MWLGYACQNISLKKSTNHNFRLTNWSNQRLIETVKRNLQDLIDILEWNASQGIDYFRIGSQFVPFASHTINNFDWMDNFRSELIDVGNLIKRYNMRISMHPDQFVLINSPNVVVWKNSLAELEYHANLLDAMQLDKSAKIQIHVGGVYGDKQAAIKRFINRFEQLPVSVKQRLVVEHDHRLYNLNDCLSIYQHAGVPIVFDTLHYKCLPGSLKFEQGLAAAIKTWREADGPPLIDYSEQQPGEVLGKHAEKLDLAEFVKFVSQLDNKDVDVMLEVKDKELSALAAIKALNQMR